MNSDELILAVISTTLLVLLLIAGIILNFFISGRQRIQQEVKLAKTRLDFEKELRQVETEVSEQVLAQLAQELHDNIGQKLTALHLLIENLKLDHPEFIEKFKPTENYLADSTQQLRLLSRTLNTDHIAHIGLQAAIQIEVERLRSLRRFEVNWQPVNTTIQLEKNQELLVFRILQEIIQNVLRHANASQLQIAMSGGQNGFELSVQDNGNGFLVEEILHSHKASGLRNILKRASLAGLECSIQSTPGEGSLYSLKKIATLD